MASYSVDVSVSNILFPEIGSPLYPKPAKEVKPAKSDREAYTGYTSSVGMSVGSIAPWFRKQPAHRECNQDGMRVVFDFERDTPKTYKFLGMDVDENFNAVIKMSSGCVIVAPMFDRDAIEVKLKDNTRYLDNDVSLVINNLTIDSVRKLATALKTGVGYELYAKADSSYNGQSLVYDDLDVLRNIIKTDIDRSSSISTGRLEFDSVLLNLVHAKKAEQISTASNSSSGDVVGYVIMSIMDYWGDVVRRYNSYYSVLSALDLWSDANRRIIGNAEFNNRMKFCCTTIDNTTGEVADHMVSFSGIAKNGSISDDNVIRSAAADVLTVLGAGSADSYYSGNIDLKDLLISMADVSGVDDVYSLDESEIQAMSVLDSLAYIDEDASLCKESYDMNDPDQRGLFVKSAIRSYERNFREFKPARNYDVTDAIAAMVARGDTVGRDPVIAADATDDTTSDIVTGTREDISVKVNKNMLLKVMKLVDKSIDRVLKDF